MENLMLISFILHLDIGIKATQALHYSFTLVWTVECSCTETTRLAVSLMPLLVSADGKSPPRHSADLCLLNEVFWAEKSQRDNRQDWPGLLVREKVFELQEPSKLRRSSLVVDICLRYPVPSLQAKEPRPVVRSGDAERGRVRCLGKGE